MVKARIRIEQFCDPAGVAKALMRASRRSPLRSDHSPHTAHHSFCLRDIILAAAVCALSAPVFADPPLERYFEQLRRRGLFSVAETYAFTRLADPKLDAQRRTDLVIELSRTYADHAAFVGPPQQDEFWHKARTIVQDELDRVPPPPRTMLLRAQQALVSAVQAEVLYRDALVQPDDGPLTAKARRAAEAAMAALEQLIQQNSAAAKDDLTPFERKTLVQSANIELGNVRCHRAELTSDAKDRAADIFDAEQAFRQALATAGDSTKLARAKLGLSECVRLQTDYGRARDMLTAIAKTDPPPASDIVDALDASRVRTWLDERKPVEAAEYLLTLRRARPQMTGELWFLQMRTLLQLRTTAEEQQDAQLAAHIRSEAELVLARVDEHAGGWWSRYCRQIWAREQSREQYGSDLDQLVRRARSEYAGGEKDAAATTFGVAAKQAWEKQQVDLAVESSYTRASILLELQQFEPAVQELLPLVERVPQHSRVPAAHLLACYALGRLYDSEKTKSRREVYTATLQAHIERYAESPTAGDARFMLGRLEEQRLQSTLALPNYLAIPVDHPRGGEATVSAARCYQTIIARMKVQEREWEALQREARETIADRLRSLPDEPAKWSVAQAEGLLGLIRLLLLSSPPDYRAAVQRLEPLQAAVVAHRSNDDPAWKNLSAPLLPLRLVALAGTGRSELARSMLSQLPENDPQRLWAVVHGLDQLSAGEPAGNIVELTELCVAAVARLEPQRDRLSAADRLEFDLARVRAYVLTGRLEPGLRVARELAAATTKDVERQRSLATVLQQSSAADAQKIARSCWRRVEAASAEGSNEWFTARLEVIRSSLAVGDRVDADKLMRITRVLYPEPANETLRARMKSLEQELHSQASSTSLQ